MYLVTSHFWQTHSHTSISYIFRQVPESPQQVQSRVSGLGHYWGLGPSGLIHHSCFSPELWITAGLIFCRLCILSCPTGRGGRDGRTSQGICSKHTASHPVRVSLPDSTAIWHGNSWRTHSAHLAVVSGTESSARGASHTPIQSLMYVYRCYCSCHRKDWLGQRLSNKYRGVIPSRTATFKRTPTHKFFAVTDMSKNIPLYSRMWGRLVPKPCALLVAVNITRWCIMLDSNSSSSPSPLGQMGSLSLSAVTHPGPFLHLDTLAWWDKPCMIITCDSTSCRDTVK